MLTLVHSASTRQVRSLRRWLVALGAGALFLPCLAARASAQLSCEDTRYHKANKGDRFASRYHVIQLYGDAAYRTTNFYSDDYDGGVSATTLRLFLPRFSELARTRLPLPDPYVGVSLSRLTDLDWENRADVEVGVEWRPFKRTSLPAGVAKWLNHSRLYISRHEANYLRDAEKFAARPQSDTRIGLELYRECNLYPIHAASDNVMWAEVWGDVSWRRTNFVVNTFRSWTLSIVPKFGVRFPRGKEAALMPYVTGEFSTTQRTESWQNRILAGGGVRVMPFRWHGGALSDVLRGGRIYVEELWLVKELEDDTGPPTPKHDVRAGVSFVVNRWH